MGWEGNHHWYPTSMQGTPILEAMFGEFTTHLSAMDHIEAHRNLKEYGVIGSIARQDLRDLEYNTEEETLEEEEEED